MTTITLHTTEPTRREHVEDHTYLPHAHGHAGTVRRRTVERKLESAVYLGAIFSAYLHGDKYVLVTASGSTFDPVSLTEADHIASFAIAAFREGRATA